jgi:predicted acetyltransferase
VELRLRPLRAQDEQLARRAQVELAGAAFDFLLDWSESLRWADYLARLSAQARGADLAPGRVPATFLVAVVDGTIVGRASIRHELNDFLLHFGGHIGYCVRPEFRRRGYATEILSQSLVVARSLGVEPVLVTCDEDNVASAAIIERAGGVLEDIRLDPSENVRRQRFWIE